MSNNPSNRAEYESVPTNNAAQPTPQAPMTFIPFPLNLLRYSAWFGLGYRMEPIDRSSILTKKGGLDLYRGDTSKYAVGITIGQFPWLPQSLDDLVSPSVTVHAVNADTGRYIQSSKRYPCLPLRTRNCLLKDSTSIPKWSQEIVLDAEFKDIVNPSTLLLFEVFDKRPALTAQSSISYEPVCWGYLTPVGRNGNPNCGILSEWNSALTTDQNKNTPIEPGTPVRRSTKLKVFDEVVIDSQPNLEQVSPTKNQEDSSLRIQLFECKRYDGVIGFIQRKIMGWPLSVLPVNRSRSNQPGNLQDDSDLFAYPDGIPPVYLQWRRLMRTPIPGAWLSLSLGPRPIEKAIGNTTRLATRQYTQRQQEADASGGVQVGPGSGQISGESSGKADRLRAAVIRRLRAPNEPCVIPDRVLHRLQVGPEGALSLQYSHTGHLLAVAARSSSTPIHLFNPSDGSYVLPGIVYNLHLFETDTGTEVWVQEAAHYGAIYGLVWSLDDNFLLSCSADGTAKVWELSILQVGTIVDENSYPKLCTTLSTSPPIPTYCAIFQEYPSSRESTQSFPFIRDLKPPKVITGGSDGKLRVWDNGKLVSYISISSVNQNTNKNDPAHAGRVQALAIHPRSRYLLSGDSTGEVLVWRLQGTNDEYCLLRKLRRDDTLSDNDNTVSDSSRGVLSLVTHPDKSINQLMCHSFTPNKLRMINLTTYRTLSSCTGYNPEHVGRQQPVFQRANLSADGRYIVAGMMAKGSESSSEESRGLTGYKIGIWDSATGAPVRTALSDFRLPHPVRAVSWHPRQHVCAVAMTGEHATVVIYSGTLSGNSSDATNRVNSSIIASFNQIARPQVDKGEGGGEDNGTSDDARAPLLQGSQLDTQSADISASKSSKAREIVEKLKASRRN